MKRQAGNPTSSFTVAQDAPPATVVAIYRAAMRAQRERLEALSIVVQSDHPWPDDVLWAVHELENRLGQLRERPRPWLLRWLPRREQRTIDLDPSSERDFELALAIAPHTIGGTGIGDGTIIWSGNDTGTSAAFELTDSEVSDVKRRVTAAGCDATRLVALHRRGKQT